GYESVSAHLSLRLLAESLSGRGIAVLRLAFPGTGNSLRTGLNDDVAEWQQAIEAAAVELRSFGISRVALVGLRLSATLAAGLAARVGAEALALWDPVVSGRRYARGLRLLATETDGGIVAAGVRFDSATLTSMSRLALVPDELPVPTLVIQRAEPSAEPDLTTEVNRALTVERLTGTSALLDVDAEVAVVPTGIIERIDGWFGHHFATAEPLVLDEPARRTTTTERPGDIELVHEAHRVGPPGLFAITTVRHGGQPRRAVIFLNNGVSPSVGPGGAWLDWAAEVARAGFLAARLDFDCLGDSPARAGTSDNDSYPVGAADDVSDLIDVLRQRGVDKVALVGLCSGALLAFDAALRRPEIGRIVAINPRFDKPYNDRLHGKVRAGGQTNRLLAIPLHKAPLFRYFEATPWPAWKLLALLRLVPRATLAVERVVKAGTKVTFLFGPDEWGMRAMQRRAPQQFARLCADPLISLRIIDTLDHSMFDAQGRSDVEAALRQEFSTVLAGGNRSQVSSSEVVST
ncbi:MAG TPA: alpha/beta hydrolase, partial [Ilumatobacteraceae bacterium]